jgi:uncharacterized protein (TIGR02145 family)
MQDWEELVDNLGGVNDATPLMRANNKWYWDDAYGGSATQWGSYDPPVSERSGFDLYPLGMATASGTPTLYSVASMFWTPDQDYPGSYRCFAMSAGYPGVNLSASGYEYNSLSVRCIKK